MTDEPTLKIVVATQAGRRCGSCSLCCKLMPMSTREDAQATRTAAEMIPALKEHVRRSKQKLGTNGLRNTIAEAVRRYIIVWLAVGVTYATIGALVDYDLYDFVAQCGTIECPLT
jgi:hypothetical protein